MSVHTVWARGSGLSHLDSPGGKGVHMKTLTLVIIGIAMAYAHHHIAIARNYVYVPPAGFVASDRTKAAMAYHGIRFAESDADGVLWFKRGGQDCRLFTVACLKALELRENHSGELR